MLLAYFNTLTRFQRSAVIFLVVWTLGSTVLLCRLA
jgi:hypothetical protein